MQLSQVRPAMARPLSNPFQHGAKPLNSAKPLKGAKPLTFGARPLEFLGAADNELTLIEKLRISDAFVSGYGPGKADIMPRQAGDKWLMATPAERKTIQEASERIAEAVIADKETSEIRAMFNALPAEAKTPSWALEGATPKETMSHHVEQFEFQKAVRAAYEQLLAANVFKTPLVLRLSDTGLSHLEDGYLGKAGQAKAKTVMKNLFMDARLTQPLFNDDLIPADNLNI